MTPRCCELLSRVALARALRALAGRFPFRRGARFLERLTPPGAHSKAFGAPFWPPGCLPGASWGPLGRHPEAQEPPRAPQKRPESPPRAAKSAPRAPQEAPSSPKRLGALFLIDLGAPSGSILGAREPQKTAKSAVLSSKIKVFAVLRAGPENGRKKAKKEPQDAPRQAQNLPREKTESGVRKSCWCIGWPPRLPRLSGGPTVNLARFPCSGAPAEKVHLSRCPWCLVVSW